MKLKRSILVTMLSACFVTVGCGSANQSSVQQQPSKISKETSAPVKTAEKAPTNEEIFLYSGSDREQKLIENAKKEGTVTFYTGMNTQDSQPIVKAFEDKYGIKVSLWRAGSEEVANRIVTENKGSRYDVDVTELAAPQAEILAREGILAPFNSAYIADIPAKAIPKHKLWIPDRFNFWVMAWNTNLVKPEEVPTRYEDLLDPKWKGKLGIEVSDAEWFANVVKQMGEEKGLNLFKQLSTMNLPVRKGHTLISGLLASGEMPIALSVYNHEAEELKTEKGAPIDWKPLQPAIGRANAVAVAKKAPHPYAALLFAEYVLSPEGQKLIKEQGRVPSSTKVDTNLNKFDYVVADSTVILDEWEKWNNLYEQLFIKKK